MDAAALKHALIDVAQRDAQLKRALCDVGLPKPRRAQPGFASLVRILVGQQLSVKAAATIHGRFETLLGSCVTPGKVLAAEDDALRAAGLSRAKATYCKALAQAVLDGALVLDTLPSLTEEEAERLLTTVKGVGPWTAQIYLLFCEGRMDVWPAGDLALQEALKRVKNLKARPNAKETVPIVAPWQPYRGAMAVFLWHYYAASNAPV